MQQIIECVPNFSEGRRPEVYEEIIATVRAVPGTQILDASADADHNRTVITFVGDAAAVEEAAFQAIKRAAGLINLDEHTGEHPRIGATDVVPFIPVRGATMKDCVELARRLGRRVGDELGIAVYLYGAAATRPEREKLSAIRRGEYELWRTEVATVAERAPDFGPNQPQPWGATVIGARPFLIAYNIFLDTENVDVARRVARAVRASSGGLQNVQALGFLVEGQAQVSMNLQNFERTPIYRVQELVAREAARHGHRITSAELIGLAPQKALIDTARWYLQLDKMEDDQLLEIRMAHAAREEEDLAAIVPHDFLSAVASGMPTPGGGSVAALAGALGAALARMVAGLTVGRKKYAGAEAEAQGVLTQATALQEALTKAIVADADAFAAVMAAYRQRDIPDHEREAAVEEATIGAGQVPLQVMRLSRGVLRQLKTIVRIGNGNAVTDAAAGGIMARAAAHAAGLNIRVNATGLKDRDRARRWGTEVDQLLEEIDALADEVSAIAAERGGF
jgi:glutamate formiminotransferase/formiminotetrahydrofolate cyclodeaminase